MEDSSSRKDFKIGGCDGQKVVDGEVMPLVLLPSEPGKSDLDSPLSALRKNKEWFEYLDDHKEQRGAALRFRCRERRGLQ